MSRSVPPAARWVVLVRGRPAESLYHHFTPIAQEVRLLSVALLEPAALAGCGVTSGATPLQGVVVGRHTLCS